MTERDDDLPSGVSTTLSFSQGNPVGPGYWNVPALLRRVADTIESIPNARVDDLVFHSMEASATEDLHITVYFHIATAEQLEVERLLERS